MSTSKKKQSDTKTTVNKLFIDQLKLLYYMLMLFKNSIVC